jgi:ribosomal protein L11 methyltransferase
LAERNGGGQRGTEYPALDLRFRIEPGEASLEDLLYAALDDYHPLAIEEEAEDEEAGRWRVFFRSATERDAAAIAVHGLSDRGVTSVAAVSVADEDWARRSQASLTAITVGRVTVAPPWDPVLSATSLEHDARIVIVIDPSMGFGTGHHQTTRLCLDLLQRLDLVGRRVIDVGTGSGVLAIAAARLGAAAVLGLDNDPDAVHNARENVHRNDVSATVEVRCTELTTLQAAPADVVTANLTAATLIQHHTALRRLLETDGALIVSGFSPDDLPEVMAALQGDAWDHAVEDDWAAALIGRRSL